MGFLRRIFGLPRRADKLKTDEATVTNVEAEKWLSETRYRRMGNLGAKHTELQVKDLLHVLNCVTQEIAVIKDMLKEKSLWDEKLYRRLRIERMIGDHNTAGAGTRQQSSIYNYTLEEKEYLRQVFDASNDEVKRFESEVEQVSSRLT